ncbi:MAG: aspartate aminotransferase family protein [Hyphomicrobiales bacterium]
MDNIIWSYGQQIKISNIEKTKGSFIFDSNGKRYLDFESGVWCTSIGHNHPLLNKAIRDQIEKIMHSGFNYTTPIISQTAQKVLDLIDFRNGKCEFLCSGSEAVEFCMRIAEIINHNHKSFTFNNSYFGAYGLAHTKDPKAWHLYDYQNCSCKEDTCHGNCKEFNSIPFEEIKTFLFEPGSSSGFVVFPSQNLIDKICEKIKENNGLVIINEVTTGIGRTGKWFGYQHYNIKPDMIAIGKGIGSGYPVSIAAVSKNALTQLGDQPINYAQSHQNDSLGARVASEVINIIQKEDLIRNSKEKGENLKERLLQLKEKYPIIKTIRNRGLLMAIDFKHSSDKITDQLLEEGIIIIKRRDSETVRIDPPLNISHEEIDLFINTLDQILSRQ